MVGADGGSQGVDNDYATRSMDGFGAFILGRNMFGPSVATGRTRHGGAGGATTRPITRRPSCSRTIRATPSRWRAARPFTSSRTIEAALERAKSAAGDKNVKIGGGVSTVRHYLQANLIDEVHFAISPVVLARRGDVRGPRSARARLLRHRTCHDRRGHPHRAREIEDEFGSCPNSSPSDSGDRAGYDRTPQTVKDAVTRRTLGHLRRCRDGDCRNAGAGAQSRCGRPRDTRRPVHEVRPACRWICGDRRRPRGRHREGLACSLRRRAWWSRSGRWSRGAAPQRRAEFIARKKSAATDGEDGLIGLPHASPQVGRLAQSLRDSYE